jgi:RND family efflux transporter MFP subunit
MSQKSKIILPLAVVLAGILLAALIVRARPKVERKEVPPVAPLVRVAAVDQQDVVLKVRSQGTVEPRVESTLVAQVAGQVIFTSKNFAVGSFFRHGEVLLQVDPQDYHLSAQQAQAQVTQAQVQLDQEKAEAVLALQEWEEIGEGEPTDLTLRKPQLANAKAALQAAEASLQRAQLDLSRTSVRAPFDGRIRTKRVGLGQYLTPNTAITDVYSTADAEVTLPVAKKDLAFLDIDIGAADWTKTRPKVQLTGEFGGASRSWNARLVRADSSFEPRTRMLNLFARVEDPFGRKIVQPAGPLPMGMFVEAEIGGKLVPDVSILPRSALRDDNRVLVVDVENRLMFRQVEVLRIENQEVFIQSGLKQGELVCVSPLEVVVEGMTVRTLPESGRITPEPQQKESL